MRHLNLILFLQFVWMTGYAQKADLLIVGGSLGGTAAALQSCRMAQEYGLKRIVLTESTDWLGGQAASQGVTSLDENIWISLYGMYDRAASGLYYELSNAIREIYRPEALKTAKTTSRTGGPDSELRQRDIRRVESDQFCPGSDWAGRLSFLPKDGVKAINRLLTPYVESGLLEIHYHCVPVRVYKKENRVVGVKFRLAAGQEFDVQARTVIDATELGDLLPLSGTEYRVGIEASADTNEPSLFDSDGKPLFDEMYPEGAQSFTFTFALEWCDPREDHRQPWDRRPENYEKLKESFSLNGYLFARDNVYNNSLGNAWPGSGFWSYRRMYDRMNFDPDLQPDLYPIFKDGQWITSFDPATHGSRFLPGTSCTNVGDIAEINWQANDYMGGTIIDVPDAIRDRRLQEAKELSVAFLYWLWYECPRDPVDMKQDWRNEENWSIDPVTGKNRGYANLKLRKDVFETPDGLSKFPYIRESRRILPLERVREQDIAGPDTRRARLFHDSLGIGHYYVMDSHASGARAQIAGRSCSKFQLPMRCMIPVKTQGLLPGCKNAGLTHLTSAAYRMHSTEFQVGQAAAVMAVLGMDDESDFKALWDAAPNPLNPSKAEKALRRVQYELLKVKTPIFWNLDAGWKTEEFIPVQFVCTLGIIKPEQDRFFPEKPFTRAQAALAAYHLTFRRYPSAYETRFTDLGADTDAELREALSFLEEKKALSWIRGTSFKPDLPVKAAEFDQTLSIVTGCGSQTMDETELTRGKACRLIFEYLKALYEL